MKKTIINYLVWIVVVFLPIFAYILNSKNILIGIMAGIISVEVFILRLNYVEKN